MPRTFVSISDASSVLASEFDNSKNAPLMATSISASSKEKVSWVCRKCSHEWEAAPLYRKRGSGCPFCAGQCVHSDKRNSMTNTHPEIAAEFNYVLNGDLHPDELIAGTHKKIWWTCKKCDHYWKATGGSRTATIGGGCPVCSNRHGVIHRDGRNSMSSTHPNLAKQFHPHKNLDLTPEKIVAGTRKKLWWKCNTCEHEWEASGDSRVRSKTGCPFCAKRALHSDGRNSLKKRHPDVARDFHPNKNPKFQLDTLSEYSNKKVWWLCSTCQHEWKTTVDNRTKQKRACPSCDGQVVHSSGYNSMLKTHPSLAAEFCLVRNKQKPSDLLAGTGRKLTWVCLQCENVWKATGASRVSQETGCPTCSRGDLHSDRRNSLASKFPEIASEFHPTRNGKITPNDFVVASNRKFWWKCSNSNCEEEWRTSVAHRTIDGTGCPTCAETGYDRSKPGQYYVIKILDDAGDIIYFKGGISNQYKKRFKQHLSHFANHSRSEKWKLKMHEVIHFEDGHIPYNLERKLLKSEIRSPNIKGVSSELFDTNPLDYARELCLIE